MKFSGVITIDKSMMMSSNGNIFRVTGPFCEEFTSHRWIPFTMQWVNRPGPLDLGAWHHLKDITNTPYSGECSKDLLDSMLICMAMQMWTHSDKGQDWFRTELPQSYGLCHEEFVFEIKSWWKLHECFVLKICICPSVVMLYDLFQVDQENIQQDSVLFITFLSGFTLFYLICFS